MSSAHTAGLLEGFRYGRGFPDIIRGTQPAAGANFALTLDGRFETRVLSALFTIDTDANAANRVVTLDYSNGQGVVFGSNGAGLVLTASTTAQQFVGSASRTIAEWAANTPVFFPIEPLFLRVGEQLQINLANKQAGDQISAIVFYVERFEVGPQGYPQGRRDN